MTTRNKRPQRSKGSSRAGPERSPAWRRKPLVVPIVAAAIAVALLFAIFLANRPGSAQGGSYTYQVGKPGPGQQAPPVELPATNGSRFDLAAHRGTSVLLYFQEGVGCEPCWKQLVDLQRDRRAITSAHIDEIVSITTNPMSDLRQKVADEGIQSIPVLSDSELVASHAYDANSYGMMGDSADGHSFILVGPDGRIRWRGDYGGAPNYTMYVPVQRLLSDIGSAGT